MASYFILPITHYKYKLLQSVDKSIRTPLISHILFVPFIVKNIRCDSQFGFKHEIPKVCPLGIKFGENFRILKFMMCEINKLDNGLIKYCSSNINKYVVNKRNLTTYLEFTPMNYPRFNFLSICSFSGKVIIINRFVPLVP